MNSFVKSKDNFKNYSKNRKNQEDGIRILEYEGVYEHGKSPLVSSFYKIWEKIEHSYENETFKPRGLARHKLISDIFYKRFYEKAIDVEVSILNEKPEFSVKGKEGPLIYPQAEGLRIIQDEGEYFKQRCKVELLIALAKSNGLIDINILLKERFGIYYLLYLKEKRKLIESDKQKGTKVLSTKIDTIENICKSINLIQKFGTSDAANTASMIYGYKDYNIKENLKGSLECLLKEIENRKVKKLDTEEKKSLSNLFEYINTMYQSVYTNDIRPKFDSRHLNIFESYDSKNLLYTDLSLKTKIYDLFKGLNSWDLALITSERANILKQLKEIKNINLKIEEPNNEGIKDKVTKKKICMILASPSDENNQTLLKEFEENILEIDIKDYEEMFIGKDEANSKDKNSANNGLIQLEEKKNYDKSKRVFYLPFWLHHHHMIILLKKINQNSDIQENILKKTGWEFISGIYYFRDGLSNKINPIYIPASSEGTFFHNDHNNLVLQFFSDLFTAKPKKIGQTVELDDFDHNNLKSTPKVFKDTVEKLLYKFHEEIIIDK